MSLKYHDLVAKPKGYGAKKARTKAGTIKGTRKTRKVKREGRRGPILGE